MPNIRIDNQPVIQITVIEPEPGKQAEALSLMTERARFMVRQPEADARRWSPGVSTWGVSSSWPRCGAALSTA